MHDILLNALCLAHLLAQYLSDTWIFDTQEYKWRQIEFKESERKPSYVPPPHPHLTPLKLA